MPVIWCHTAIMSRMSRRHMSSGGGTEHPRESRLRPASASASNSASASGAFSVSRRLGTAVKKRRTLSTRPRNNRTLQKQTPHKSFGYNHVIASKFTKLSLQVCVWQVVAWRFCELSPVRCRRAALQNRIHRSSAN